MAPPLRAITIVALSAVLMVAGGCSGTDIAFVESDTYYTGATIASVADTVDPPPALGQPVDDAEDLRHDALVELRAMGGEAAQVADLLTTQFPGPVRSVPYYVESSTFEDEDAWIILEVWGSEGETLSETRVWVFDPTTERVLFTAAVN